MVLWTRLAPRPLEPNGGMPLDVVPVDWELATDEKMRHVVRRGTEYASPEWAHSVHVEPQGLEPGRYYWYRFTSGDVRSPVGRTRTAPAFGAPTDRLKVAVASCQNYEHGYFSAYRHMIRDDVDLVLHLGDYIYEGTWGANCVRHHGAGDCGTLDDYRARYALYRSDPDLAAAHAAYPWLVTWDDHEVMNDYAGVVGYGPKTREAFRERRAAAYRAYYEHMPLPSSAAPSGSQLRLYAQRAFGDLASIYMLDQRQYRSQECAGETRQASNRTMLGALQEDWLNERLSKTRARWNLLGQGTMMSHVSSETEASVRYGGDAWTGYPAARARLMESLADSRVSNPVVLSGDIHAFVVSGINRVPEQFDSEVVATEFVGSSISSDPVSGHFESLRASNPNVQFADDKHRGYVRLDITPQRLTADLVSVDNVRERKTSASTLRSYVVESGVPRAVKV